MNALKNPAHRAWLVLLVATGITWYLGEVGAAGTLAIVSMLLIAFVKGRLVILDHGRGAFSLYGYLDELNVQRGMAVDRGSVVADAIAAGPEVEHAHALGRAPRLPCSTRLPAGSFGSARDSRTR